MAALDARNSAGYPAPVGLSAEVVVLTVRGGELRVVVRDRDASGPEGAPAPPPALPGGFVAPDERPGAAAVRHLAEKTGLRPHYLEQLGAYGDPARDDRGWIPGVGYVALVPPGQPPTVPGATWRAVAGLGALAYDHQDMLRDALDRVRGKLWWSNVAVGILPGAFTMSDARDVYQAICDLRYDASTFARDLRSTGLVEPVGEKRRLGPGRPAALHRFVSHDLQWGAGRRKRVGAPRPGPQVGRPGGDVLVG